MKQDGMKMQDTHPSSVTDAHQHTYHFISEENMEKQHVIPLTHREKYNVLYATLLPTFLSGFLLRAHVLGWTIPIEGLRILQANSASVQAAIHGISFLLGFIQVWALYKWSGCDIKLGINKKAIIPDALPLWTGMNPARVGLDLPTRSAFLLMLLVGFALVPPALLWVGAVTPVTISIIKPREMTIPDYTNITLLKEYPSELDAQGPSVRNMKGFFTFSPAVQYTGKLLASAASASTVDRSSHRSLKFGTSGYTYAGRSYGVGASVGLFDDDIERDITITDYAYSEPGYYSVINCDYPSNPNFTLSRIDYGYNLYAAAGYLPDSTCGPEYSEYLGHAMDTIVAMGVSHCEDSPRQYVAIAAGKLYSTLDGILCTVDFVPISFSVAVNIAARSISVTPIHSPRRDINLARNLTRALMRQFELLTNDETNMYVSQVGNAFNASIAAYKMAQGMNTFMTEAEATLSGVSNALTAMADDLLVSYGSAQLMVGNFTQATSGLVRVTALKLGQPLNVIVIFTLNTIMLLLLSFDILPVFAEEGSSALIASVEGQ